MGGNVVRLFQKRLTLDERLQLTRDKTVDAVDVMTTLTNFKDIRRLAIRALPINMEFSVVYKVDDGESMKNRIRILEMRDREVDGRIEVDYDRKAKVLVLTYRADSRPGVTELMASKRREFSNKFVSSEIDALSKDSLKTR